MALDGEFGEGNGSGDGMKFNVNSYVRVKLTDLGRERLKADHDALWVGRKRTYDYHLPPEDADGWSKWQLWDLMESLGKYMGMGRHPPFETEMEIVPDRAPQAPTEPAGGVIEQADRMNEKQP